VAASRSELYEELFHDHFWMLVRLARLLGADDPEDVVQDAFVSLHHKIDMLHHPDAALAYLRSSVCNRSRSRLRHLRMARRRHAQLAPRGEVTSAELQVVHTEDVRRLLEAIGGLPRRQREALVLRFWLDLSERETAGVLGVAIGTVKSHTARAMASLARTMKEPS
jgi:RNA polymerase sigma factor (sigma-70 family)